MAANIAPLQPATLAAFRPWGSSQGAGRANCRCKGNTFFRFYELGCKKMNKAKKTV